MGHMARTNDIDTSGRTEHPQNMTVATDLKKKHWFIVLSLSSAVALQKTQTLVKVEQGIT